LYSCFNRNIRYAVVLVLCRGKFVTYFQALLTSWIGIVKVSDLVAEVPTWRSPKFQRGTETFYSVAAVNCTNFSSGIVRLKCVC
jgi:hypothetical protein